MRACAYISQLLPSPALSPPPAPRADEFVSQCSTQEEEVAAAAKDLVEAVQDPTLEGTQVRGSSMWTPGTHWKHTLYIHTYYGIVL